MFGKNKKQTTTEVHLEVNFVQPHKGEAYFYTPIAHATFQDQKERKQVFTDYDLSLAGKLKLIFEREKMSWFEVKEETAPLKNDHYFTLYYFPHRLVSRRASSREEKATLEDIRKLFEFFITQAQTRLAEIQQIPSPTASGFIAEEPEVVSIVAAAVPMEEQEMMQTQNSEVIERVSKKRKGTEN
jgi:hypothetical protein